MGFGKRDKKARKRLPEERYFKYFEPRVTTREYRLFRQTRVRKLNWYEKLVRATSGFMKMSPGKSTREDLHKAISFTGMRITPEGVMSLAMTTIIFSIIFAVFYAVYSVTYGTENAIFSLLIVAAGGLLAYYFLKYPGSYMKTLRIRASSQVVLAILYMVVSMRISPNLERALRFTAANVSGPLAWDMRKLLWDIELRKYYSAEDALEDYIVKWKPENEEFAEALRLIKDSQKHAPERAKKMLDESLEVILGGTKTRMKHYSQDLLMPVMVIHMMGIVLPMLGTIMAPLVAVFMSDLVSPIHFILGYDVILPIIIIWFINNTLNKRPVTLSQVDISRHPLLPKGNSFRIKGKHIPVFPLALLTLLVFLTPPLLFFIENPSILMSGIETDVPHDTFSLSMSLLVILGIGLSMAVYFILSNFQKARIQNSVQKIEGEFELALFQLGNKIAGGTPTELAIEQAIDDVKDLEISGLFKRTLRNIKTLGMTFEDAMFHRDYGAIRYYPSRLIRNIMTAVIDTSKKGLTYASDSMLRISNYLKNIRETHEYIRDLLSETVSSMKFQAYFLTPLITGLIVSLASVIIKVIIKLGQFLENSGFGSSLTGDQFGVSEIFGNVGSTVSPEFFQLIIGVYLIEVIVILAMFLTRITQGENKINQWYLAGKMLIVALIIYSLVALTADSMFGGLIESALSNIGYI